MESHIIWVYNIFAKMQSVRCHSVVIIGSNMPLEAGQRKNINQVIMF